MLTILGKYFFTSVVVSPGTVSQSLSARTNVDLVGNPKQACQYRTCSSLEWRRTAGEADTMAVAVIAGWAVKAGAIGCENVDKSTIQRRVMASLYPQNSVVLFLINSTFLELYTTVKPMSTS